MLYLLILLGNKTDLENERKISSKEASEFAKVNWLFAATEISAKEDLRIEEAFLTLIRAGAYPEGLVRLEPPPRNFSEVLAKGKI